MMPVPYMDDALKDEKGEYISYNYSGQPSFVAVPNKAKNKEGAKAFLAYVCRDDMLRLYTEICGTPMPFEYDVESISLNSFRSPVSTSGKIPPLGSRIREALFGRDSKCANSTRAIRMSIFSSIIPA